MSSMWVWLIVAWVSVFVIKFRWYVVCGLIGIIVMTLSPVRMFTIWCAKLGIKIANDKLK